MKPITKRQQAILDFIKEEVDKIANEIMEEA